MAEARGAARHLSQRHSWRRADKHHWTGHLRVAEYFLGRYTEGTGAHGPEDLKPLRVFEDGGNTGRSVMDKRYEVLSSASSPAVCPQGEQA